MQPYMSTISRTAEYNRIKMAKGCGFSPGCGSCVRSESDTDVPLKSGEKIDEMSGALPQRLVTMLKTHNVQEKSKLQYLRLAATVAAAIGGVFALLKYKAEVESKEKGERWKASGETRGRTEKVESAERENELKCWTREERKR